MQPTTSEADSVRTTGGGGLLHVAGGGRRGRGSQSGLPSSAHVWKRTGPRPLREDGHGIPDGATQCKPMGGHAATLPIPTTGILLQLRKPGPLRNQLPISETRSRGAADPSLPELPRIWTFCSPVPKTGTGKAGIPTRGSPTSGTDNAQLRPYGRNRKSEKMTR